MRTLPQAQAPLCLPGRYWGCAFVSVPPLAKSAAFSPLNTSSMGARSLFAHTLTVAPSPKASFLQAQARASFPQHRPHKLQQLASVKGMLWFSHVLLHLNTHSSPWAQSSESIWQGMLSRPSPQCRCSRVPLESPSSLAFMHPNTIT